MFDDKTENSLQRTLVTEFIDWPKHLKFFGKIALFQVGEGIKKNWPYFGYLWSAFFSSKLNFQAPVQIIYSMW